jgi:Domain of unknown function (DUF4296)
MQMKKILPFLLVLLSLLSCKKELTKTPNHLIEKDEMVDIMYDLSLLEAIKNQNYSSTDSLKINSNEYILKKYKIDSLQFAQNNIYYAADYKEYKKMFEKVKKRLDNNKTLVETSIKNQKKKDILLKKKQQKLKIKRETDSIKNAKQKLKTVKVADSIKKI